MFEEEKLEPEQIKEELDNIGASISDVQYSQYLSLIVKKINILQKNQRSSMLKR